METSIILERNVQITMCSQWGLIAAQPRNQLCGPLLGLGAVAEMAKLRLSLPLHDTVTGGWHLTHRLHFSSPLTFRWEHTVSSHQWNVRASDCQAGRQLRSRGFFTTLSFLLSTSQIRRILKPLRMAETQLEGDGSCFQARKTPI